MRPARNRRALVLAGGGHLARLSDIPGRNVVQRLERARPGSCVVLLTHYVFADVAERRAEDLARLRSETIGVAGALARPDRRQWLADVDATLLFGDTARLIGADESETEVAAPPFLNLDGTPMTGVTLRQVGDWYLYLGPSAALTLVPPTSRSSETTS